MASRIMQEVVHGKKTIGQIRHFTVEDPQKFNTDLFKTQNKDNSSVQSRHQMIIHLLFFKYIKTAGDSDCVVAVGPSRAADPSRAAVAAFAAAAVVFAVVAAFVVA